MRMLNIIIFMMLAFASSYNGIAGPKLISKSKVLDEFAACIAKQYPNAAREFLKTQIGSKEELKAADSLVERGDQCMGGRAVLSMHTGQIRGSFAQALLVVDTDRADRIARQMPAQPQRIEVSEGRAFVADFANCIAKSAPQRSLELIRSERASTAERQAVLALAEEMKACMPQGLAYPLNIPDVRNHVADALYRMSETGNA